MPDDYLKKLDEDNNKLVHELIDKLKNTGIVNLDELIGFKLQKSRCFVPRVLCNMVSYPVMSLIPLYDVVFVPIFSEFEINKKTVKISGDKGEEMFKTLHGFTPTEIAMLSEKGRLIPYFVEKYVEYDERIVEPLLQPGIPRIPFQLRR
jgi:hypothetical protein